MKTKSFFLSACAGLFLLASCSSNGPSAESKAKVAAFDSSWTAMGTVAMAWGDSINQAATMCETACKNETMECCKHLKETKDSLLSPCMENMKSFQEMKASWDAEMPMWTALQAKLDTLKANVASGKATDAEVNTTLAELQGAADKGNAEMGPWIEKIKAAKSSCMNNMTAAKAGLEGKACSDKKCATMHKKS